MPHQRKHHRWLMSAFVRWNRATSYQTVRIYIRKNWRKKCKNNLFRMEQGQCFNFYQTIKWRNKRPQEKLKSCHWNHSFNLKLSFTARVHRLQRKLSDAKTTFKRLLVSEVDRTHFMLFENVRVSGSLINAFRSPPFTFMNKEILVLCARFTLTHYSIFQQVLRLQICSKCLKAFPRLKAYKVVLWVDVNPTIMSDIKQLWRTPIASVVIQELITFIIH